MASIYKDFFSLDIPTAVGERGAGSGMSASTPSGIPSQRLSMQVKGLRCEAYRGFAPVEDGRFIIVKPLGEDGLLCAMIDPSGRGPQAVDIGACLKDAIESQLGADFLRYAGQKPVAALDRLDDIVDQAMSGLHIPGYFSMMGALIVSAKTGRASLLCRGLSGMAGLRAGGAPLWASGAGLPANGVIPRDFLFMRGLKPVKEYQIRPGDSLIITNAQYSELPGDHETSEKDLLPRMAARAARGGRLEAGGLALEISPAEAAGLSIPERMAVAMHALRLAALNSDPGLERGDLTLDAGQVGYFEAICLASGLSLPKPERDERAFVRYADSAPLAIKGLLVVSITREVS